MVGVDLRRNRCRGRRRDRFGAGQLQGGQTHHRDLASTWRARSAATLIAIALLRSAAIAEVTRSPYLFDAIRTAALYAARTDGARPHRRAAGSSPPGRPEKVALRARSESKPGCVYYFEAFSCTLPVSAALENALVALAAAYRPPPPPPPPAVSNGARFRFEFARTGTARAHARSARKKPAGNGDIAHEDVVIGAARRFGADMPVIVQASALAATVMANSVRAPDALGAGKPSKTATGCQSAISRENEEQQHRRRAA